MCMLLADEAIAAFAQLAYSEAQDGRHSLLFSPTPSASPSAHACTTPGPAAACLSALSPVPRSGPCLTPLRNAQALHAQAGHMHPDHVSLAFLDEACTLLLLQCEEALPGASPLPFSACMGQLTHCRHAVLPSHRLPVCSCLPAGWGQSLDAIHADRSAERPLIPRPTCCQQQQAVDHFQWWRCSWCYCKQAPEPKPAEP